MKASPLLVGLILLLTLAQAWSRANWQTMEGCTLIMNASNDGDSFHVRAKGKEYIFRLYFVDTPETDNGIPARVKEQAKYFGITVPQTLEVGRVAKTFTRSELAGTFSVRTYFEDALGRSRLERFYAFVETKDGDLSELLVKNGLARVHGASAIPVGVSSARAEVQKLLGYERNAKQEKIGGWGVANGRLRMRAEQNANPNQADSFDKFFHPERTASPSSPAATPEPSPMARQAAASPIPMPATSPAKLDINRATEAQLKELPGIGPALAGRIIAARPFKSADDLRTVKGIGQVRYEKLRPSFE